MILYFTNGLTEKFRVELNLRKPTKLADAFQLATICDRSLAIGYDKKCAEMFIHGAKNALIPTLTLFFDSLIRFGKVPEEFYVSLISTSPCWIASLEANKAFDKL